MNQKTRDLLLVISALIITAIIAFQFLQAQSDRRSAIRAIENIGIQTANSLLTLDRRGVNQLSRLVENLKAKNRKLAISNRELKKENRRILKKYSFQLDREKTKSEIEWVNKK